MSRKLSGVHGRAQAAFLRNLCVRTVVRNCSGAITVRVVSTAQRVRSCFGSWIVATHLKLAAVERQHLLRHQQFRARGRQLRERRAGRRPACRGRRPARRGTRLPGGRALAPARCRPRSLTSLQVPSGASASEVMQPPPGWGNGCHVPLGHALEGQVARRPGSGTRTAPRGSRPTTKAGAWPSSGSLRSAGGGMAVHSRAPDLQRWIAGVNAEAMPTTITEPSPKVSEPIGDESFRQLRPRRRGAVVQAVDRRLLRRGEVAAERRVVDVPAQAEERAVLRDREVAVVREHRRGAGEQGVDPRAVAPAFDPVGHAGARDAGLALRGRRGRGQRPPTAITHSSGQPRRHSVALCSGASPSASASTPRPYTATLPPASGRTASASSDTAASCSVRSEWYLSEGTGSSSLGRRLRDVLGDRLKRVAGAGERAGEGEPASEHGRRYHGAGAGSPGRENARRSRGALHRNMDARRSLGREDARQSRERLASNMDASTIA